MSWSLADAEEHLLARELFGMRFGLERMHALTSALGSPQESFRSIHVVGTNGKSSTARMTCALLEEHGIRAGAYLSPHLVSFAERVQVGGRDCPPDTFAAAVERAAGAAAALESEDDPVTQFELLTAAAFEVLARAGVDVAVVEAGLGGRHDATNVLHARVVALTTVGLEHTRWLGDTVPAIALEKLAVVKHGATLVVGDVDAEVQELARTAADRAGGRLVNAAVRAARTPAAGRLTGYQRANFAVAQAAAAAFAGVLDEDAIARAAAAVRVPGRLQVIGRDPLTIVDGAHNPDGVRALLAALEEITGERGLVAVVSILEDKDAAAMLAELVPRCRALVLTAAPTPRALAPAELARLAGTAGARVEEDPRAALALARELAGPQGAVVATGSTYLVAELLGAPGARRASAL